MQTIPVMGWVFPVVLLVIAAAFWLGVRSSGGAREDSDLERRLRERTFTGAPRARLEWPRDRRRPTLAQLVRIGESHGYRLVSRTEAEHVYILDFQRVEDDDL
ncbi:hypothetical protein MHY29_05650 [Micrococcus sp. ACRRV]|uniref:hypothetical protein n=1 Tax=Micrococcus sp. ACRRV TaxID=2918203 RepID=UPI001EF2B080|nr:hypothetical protein [Micrococcus sp. ACRRV]MCG7422317.1 hypothetical protein [Micrococcus sp. ACRRV]